MFSKTEKKSFTANDMKARSDLPSVKRQRASMQGPEPSIANNGRVKGSE